MKHINTDKTRELMRGHRKWLDFFPRTLAIVALLGSLAVAQAETWSFKIVNAPVALNKNSPKFESIRVTGSGTFDPVLGVVTACGTYTLFNAFDHPNGPVIYATWHSSTFVGWVQDPAPKSRHHHHRPPTGTLTIQFDSSDPIANPDPTKPGQITLTQAGVQGPMVAGEPFIIPPDGSGGCVRFDDDDDEPFFPPVP